jgi:hypothetical protein
MKQSPPSFAIKLFLLLLMVVAISCVTPARVQAQARTRDLTIQEHQMSALEREKTRPREPKQILAEVNEDMGRLKLLNGEISSQAAMTEQQLNYKAIVGNLVEINKRATRLGTDLALPPAEKEEKRTVGKDIGKVELQSSLLELNKLLDGFLNNPIFTDTGTVDLHLAAKAKGDLDDVIMISDKLRKNAEKRSKASVKTP